MQGSALLIGYVQGRYICARCGEFDVICEEHVSVKKELKCPKCSKLAGLVTECKGKSLRPKFGPTKVRDLSVAELDSGIELRAIKHKSIGRSRKQGRCEPCGCSSFSSLSGAQYQAKQMQIQYGVPYDSIACPQGNGFHFIPRRSPDAAA